MNYNPAFSANTFIPQDGLRHPSVSSEAESDNDHISINLSNEGDIVTFNRDASQNPPTTQIELDRDSNNVIASSDIVVMADITSNEGDIVTFNREANQNPTTTQIELDRNSNNFIASSDIFVIADITPV